MNEPTAQPSLHERLLMSQMTTQDLQKTLEAIDEFAANLYLYGKNDLDAKRQAIFDTETALLIEQAMKQQTIHTSEHEALHKILTEAKEALTKARILVLTLATNPTSKMLTTFSAFTKEQFGVDVVLEINKNPSIIGGAIIVFNGYFLDYSLRKKLDILFEVKKEEIQKHLQ